VYYRISIDNRQIENGFVILCRSFTKGKFKLILFDNKGSIFHKDDSVKYTNKPFTQAALYFTNFDTYRLDEHTASTSTNEKEIPIIFSKLDSFQASKKSITPGQYLLCVYGDNFIGKTNFNVTAVLAKNDAPEVFCFANIGIIKNYKNYQN
jgi:hypothetical protein